VEIKKPPIRPSILSAILVDSIRTAIVTAGVIGGLCHITTYLKIKNGNKKSPHSGGLHI